MNSARSEGTSEISVGIMRLSINVLRQELIVDDEASFEPAPAPAVAEPAGEKLGWAFFERAQ